MYYEDQPTAPTPNFYNDTEEYENGVEDIDLEEEPKEESLSLINNERFNCKKRSKTQRQKK